MIWQDIVFAIAGIIFSIALVPQVIHGFKYKKTTIQKNTAFWTAFFLFICAITSFTLRLYLTSFVYISSGILWSILLYQSIKYKEKK